MNEHIGEIRRRRQNLLVVEGNHERNKLFWLIFKEDKYKECFESLDLTEILRIQNDVRQDINMGYIWVLNTCIFFVAEYNFALVIDSWNCRRYFRGRRMLKIRAKREWDTAGQQGRASGKEGQKWELYFGQL